MWLYPLIRKRTIRSLAIGDSILLHYRMSTHTLLTLKGPYTNTNWSSTNTYTTSRKHVKAYSEIIYYKKSTVSTDKSGNLVITTSTKASGSSSEVRNSTNNSYSTTISPISPLYWTKTYAHPIEYQIYAFWII